MVGIDLRNLAQYAMTGNELLEIAVGTVSPSRLSTLNVSEQASSPAAKLVGVAHMKSSASGMVEDWQWLKVAADAGSRNTAAGAAGTST